jgi:hypothetical protein
LSRWVVDVRGRRSATVVGEEKGLTERKVTRRGRGDERRAAAAARVGGDDDDKAGAAAAAAAR